MIATLKPYSEYKESGQPWVGQIPRHWGQRRMKLLFKERTQKGYPTEPLLAATQSKGVVRKEDYGARTVTAMNGLENLKLVEVGDFVISLRSFQGGIEVSYARGIISPAYTVLTPRGELTPGYYRLYFKSFQFISSSTLFVTGIREGQNIDYERLGRAFMPFPPPDEQVAIVRFLDWANGRLDRAIRAKRQVITLLNEQKQAIVHRAVTQGLDPSVLFRPSGIPWLGNIPRHWEVRRVASFAHKVTNGWVGPTREILRDAGVPYLQSLHVKAGEIRFKKKYFVDEVWLGRREKIRLRTGDVVVVQTGDVGQTAHIPAEFDGAGCHALIIIGTNLSVIGGSYLSQVLNCWYGKVALKLIETGALLPHLNCGYVRDVQIPVPPLPEQLAIEKHLGSMLEPVSITISRLEREIDLLRELRIRLVADVVTGKLDVRDVAARLPDEAPSDTSEDDANLPGESEAADEEASV